MHRDLLKSKLERYNPDNLEEINDKQKMLDFLHTCENCFDNAVSFGHFTGTCWLVNNDNTQFLLTLHRKIGLWLTLGGHADGCNDLIQVALREAHEESGLSHIDAVSSDIFDVDVHLIEKQNDVPAHYHFDVRFLLRTSDRNEDIKISNESKDLRWFSEPPYNFSNLGSDIPRLFRKWKKFQKN
ncbi:MAG: NUDIX domain-containing protein [Alphaproteobacteria bacterium]|nr:NUDIX domain-containing protein [Alphaproteobacteria bacterium]